MRTSLVPGMLNVLAYNLNRGSDDVRLFEMANVYEAKDDHAVEPKRLCLGATGSAVVPSVHQPARPLSFLDLKGDVETLLSAFEQKNLTYDAQTLDYYHPGRSARALIDGEVVAQFGQIHPDTANNRKLRQDIFIAEIYLDRLYRHGLRGIDYQPLPKYPAVERDFSFIFADTVTFEQIEKTVVALRLSHLRKLVPVEIFRGGSVPAGKYSLLLRTAFQSGERTLREDEVAQWSAQIVESLEKLGGTLRAS
jgi:phenylalanyl-tRNA synthetase beta chain